MGVSMKRTLSIAILAILILSILPLAVASIPRAAAQTITSLSTSRDEWGNVYYNMNFTVTAISSSDVGTNLSCLITVYTSTGAIVQQTTINLTKNAAASYYGHYVYETLLGVNKTGALYWYTKTANLIYSSLSEGMTIAITCGNLQDKLVFKHVPASFSIRTEVPSPIWYVVTKDFYIVAPDLNKNPEAKDVYYLENITFINYLTGKNITLEKVGIEEIDVNSGTFNLSGTVMSGISLENTSTITVANKTPAWIYLPKNAGVELNVTFVDLGAAGNKTYVELKEVKVPIWGLVISASGSDVITNITNATPTSFAITNVVASGQMTISGTIWGRTVTLTLPVKITFDLSGTITVTANSQVTIELSNIKMVIKSIEIDARYLYAYVWMAGVEIGVNEPNEISAYVPTYIGSTTLEKITTSVTVKKYIGEVSGEASLAKGLTVTVKDLGANFDSQTAENVTVVLSAGSCTVTRYPTETDVNTGVFTDSLTPSDLINNFFATGCLGPKSNEITVTYVDAAGYTRTATIAVAYTTAELEVSPTTVVPKYGYITVTIKDSDLNLDPSVREAYRVTLSAGSPIVMELKAPGLGVEGRLMIYAVDSSGNEYLVTATNTFTVVFLETGTNTSTFVATIPLEYVGTVPNIVKYEVIYEDEYTAAVEPQNITVTLSIGQISISVAEKEVPLTAAGSVTLHVTINDQSLNTDSLKADTAYVNVTAYAYDGSSQQLVTNYPLSETGINTGVFEGTISVDVSKLPPKFIGGYLVVSYNSPAKGVVESDHIKLVLYPADIEVNGSKTITVTYGQVLEIKVIDKDYDLDQQSVNKFNATQLNVYFNAYSPSISGAPTLDNKLGTAVEFTETGEDTGVFVAYVKVSEKLGTPGQCFYIVHVDARPTFVTPNMSAWPALDTIPPAYVKVCIKPTFATLSISTTKVGPRGEVTVTVKDIDMNKDPEATDTVTIYIHWPWGWETAQATETGVNTGVFTYTIDLSKYSASDIAGKTITVMYVDRYTPNGTILRLEKSFNVITWNPELLSPTNATVLTPGEKVKIVIKDPDANTDPNAVDSIRVRVYSSTDPVGTTLTLYENGTDTGVFVGEVLLTTTPLEIRGGWVLVSSVDTLYISYTDEFPSPYTGESKTFVWSVPVGVKLVLPCKAAQPTILTPAGKPIEKVTAGSMVLIAGNVTNLATTAKSITVIVIVRNAETNVAVYYGVSSVYLGPKASGTFAVGWTPTEPGTYKIEIYIVKSLTERVPLAKPISTTVTVYG